MATTSTRLSQESRSFVSCMLARFGKSQVKSLNERQDNYRLSYILGEVCYVAQRNLYAEIPFALNAVAYGLGWAIETGRINGVTCMALRQMSVKDLLMLVARIHEQGIQQGEIAAWLMSQNLQPAT